MSENNEKPSTLDEATQRLNELQATLKELQLNMGDLTTEREDEMRTVLLAAREKLDEQDKLLQRLTTTPLTYATVLMVKGGESSDGPIEEGSKVLVDNARTGKIQRVDKSDNWVLVEHHDGRSPDLEWYAPSRVSLPSKPQHVIVMLDGRFTELLAVPGLKLQPGDAVKLSTETMQIVEVVDNFTATGNLAVVRKAPNGAQLVEVEFGGDVRVVFRGKHEKFTVGDRVVLDSTQSIVLENLGKDNDRFAVTEATNVSWQNIGGLVQAKQALIEAVELPYLNPGLFEFYGKKPPKGILLYGPPGCGKTMLGKAVATALAKLHGQDGSTGYFYIKGPEILDKFVGVSEATIRQIFANARAHQAEHGYPAVIFIDEADAVMRKRGSGISSDTENTIVPMFLTEMDGLVASGAVVILATNRPDMLDPAITRDERIDRKVKVTRPTQDTATEIFEMYLQDVPLHNGYTVSELAQTAAAELFADSLVLYRILMRAGTALDFTFAELVNGAMIKGIVGLATSIAMQRDLQEGTKDGLRRDDLIQAVKDVFAQNIDLNHDNELEDFTDPYKADLISIQPVASAAA